MEWSLDTCLYCEQHWRYTIVRHACIGMARHGIICYTTIFLACQLIHGFTYLKHGMFTHTGYVLTNMHMHGWLLLWNYISISVSVKLARRIAELVGDHPRTCMSGNSIYRKDCECFIMNGHC